MEIDGNVNLSTIFTVQCDNFSKTVCQQMQKFYADEIFVDCFLACDEDSEEIPAHRIILSAWSPVLAKIFKRHRDKHPIIFLRDTSVSDIKAIIEYIYKGSTNIPYGRLFNFIRVAQSLKISGWEESVKFARCDVNVESQEDKLSIIDQDGEDTTNLLFHEEEGLKQEDNDECLEIERLETTDADMGSMPEDQETIDEDLSVIIVRNDIPNTLQVEPKRMRPGRVKMNRLLKAGPFESAFSCPNCGNSFTRESSYINHFRYDCNQVHICTLCHKKFKNKRHLLDHVRDDCGRVNVCPNCGRLFKQKVNLTTHLKHYCKDVKEKTAVESWLGVRLRAD